MFCQVKQKYKNLDVKVATDKNISVIFLHHPLLEILLATTGSWKLKMALTWASFEIIGTDEVNYTGIFFRKIIFMQSIFWQLIKSLWNICKTQKNMDCLKMLLKKLAFMIEMTKNTEQQRIASSIYRWVFSKVNEFEFPSKIM